MKTIFRKIFLTAVILTGVAVSISRSQNLDGFKYNGIFQPDKNMVTEQFQFNGYTNYWHNIFRDQIRYGNLFKITVPKMDYTIAQARVDLATEFGIPGLAMDDCKPGGTVPTINSNHIALLVVGGAVGQCIGFYGMGSIAPDPDHPGAPKPEFITKRIHGATLTRAGR